MNRIPVVICALCALSFAAACTKKIDAGKVEKHVLEKLVAGGFKISTVTCPKDTKVTKGEKFMCDAKGDDGELKIEVTMTDDDGYVTYKPVGLIDTKFFTDDAAKSNPNHKLTFDCPKRLVILEKKGDTTTCDVSDGDKKGKFVITVEDAEKGSVGYAIKMD